MTWHAATVVRTTPTSQGSREITLAVPGFADALPGQHVDLRLTSFDGYQATRAYSLSLTGKKERADILVDHVEDGEVSGYLVEVARVGDVMEVRGPIGGYFVWDPAGATRPVLMVAGGSGIVPALSMVRAEAEARSGVPMTLLVSVRTPAEEIAREELEALASDVPNIVVQWIHTRTAPPFSDREAGRIGVPDLDVPGFGPENAPEVFVCGPTGFVDAVADHLEVLGHEAENVRTERFGGR